ncbi:DUF1304 domain-containing protein [Sorangium sp. So ce1335]|uniref:DUF1304 domain-containing protein n=1 Tax=Sorangium sp. So ce1335 TaxID=3133335 RepID=UPI003F60A74F
MQIASTLLVILVAIEHVYFLILEMFLWTTPRGLRTFGMTQELADATATLAKNQGLYNGFLAAGLFWSLLSHDAGDALERKTFFLGCVIVAGIYGGITVGRRLFFVQGVPALLALALVWLSRGA